MGSTKTSPGPSIRGSYRPSAIAAPPQSSSPAAALTPSYLAATANVTRKMAGRATPQRTSGPKMSPLSRAAVASAAAAASGAGRRQATGATRTRTPMKAPALTFGWVAASTPLARMTVPPASSMATATSSTLRPATVQVNGARSALAAVIPPTSRLSCRFIVGVPWPGFNLPRYLRSAAGIALAATAAGICRREARRRRSSSVPSTTTEMTSTPIPANPYHGGEPFARWWCTGAARSA